MVAVVLGCGPTVDASDDDAGGSGDASSARADGDSAPGDDGGGDGASDGPGTTAACTANWLSGCQSFCAATVTCDPTQGSFEACVQGCSDALTEASSGCQQARCAALECKGALDCTTLAAGSPACDAIDSDATEVCNGDAGVVVGCAGYDYVDGSCAVICDDDHSMRCADSTCTCFTGDTVVGSCELEAACTGLNADIGYDDCCGF
jgi:hypothetical protein